MALHPRHEHRLRGERLVAVLVVCALVLLALAIISTARGSGWPGAAYLLGAALALLAVAATVAFARLLTSPPGRRKLGLLIVVLPSLAIVLMEIALYFLDDRHFSEMTEHLLTASLAAGAIPVSMYILRAFARIQDELDLRATRLQELHERSVSVAAEASLPRLRRLISEGVTEVLDADRAALVLEPLEPSGRAGGDAGASGDGEREHDAGDELARALLADGGRGTQPGTLLRVRLPGHAATGAVVASRSGRPFTEEDELLLDMFAVAASAGVENVRRLEEAQHRATVEERERVARDLHDELGQLLGFLTLRIHAAQELRERGRYEELEADLEELERAAATLGDHVREAILGLRARVGADRALGEALKDYVEEYGLQAGIDARYEGSCEVGSNLSLATQHQILRIAQEALTNVRRHAGARHVVVRLEQPGTELELSVADDGVGFDPSQPTSHFGLRTMAERAETVEGTLEIHASPGGGTVVRLLVSAVGG